ncbi:response regulator receiver protein [Trichodesmium erythraeum IMS101]|uniref:Protein PatA n=1 Tax=Trichodesmium erythraeum (strain IMS101) TaxID=203124 RepID=Q118M2_TRIEI|nr:response regulator [Trichodesmium erythraeum GBRTRLIN201]
MTSYENSNNKLFDVFLNDIPDKFTGKLEVKSSRQSWTIFLCIGHLAWAIGGKHYNRRFYKIWHQFCSNVPLEKIKLGKQDTLFCDYYHIMSVLSRRKILTIPQIKAVVLGNLEEVLFDILQEESQEKLTYDVSNSGFDKTSTIISSIVRLETVISRVNKLWKNWQNSNLAAYSPNLIPTIINYEKLQKIAKNNTYKTITKLVDGKKSLRETAVLFKKDVRELTLFLIPYVKNKLIHFKEGADKKNLERSTQDVHKKTIPKQSQALIICVDDSKETCYILEKIIKKTGYKFMGIQDSIKALFMIIESKPDLIFLDLMMPIANGYEICTQLRRVPMFENTPIIILTGSDGVVDRVRAKMVGATGYLTKPIEPKKVLALVKNYLQNPRSPDTQIKSDESDL